MSVGLIQFVLVNSLQDIFERNFHRREMENNFDLVLDNLETTLQRQAQAKNGVCGCD